MAFMASILAYRANSKARRMHTGAAAVLCYNHAHFPLPAVRLHDPFNRWVHPDPERRVGGFVLVELR